jgi:phospholipid transport system substrate-binding protein
MNIISSRRRFLILAATGAASSTFALPGTAFAAMDPAAARIQAFYDVLLDAMKQGKTIGIQGRFEKLLPAVHNTFDMPALTKTACGPAWAKIPPDKQKALIEAFERMVAARYANQFSGYSGERFVVEPAVIKRNADRIVRTQLVPADGEPTVLNYLMRGSGDDWKVEDVYLDGTISQLAVWRSDFAAVLQSGGADALLAKLKELTAQLMKGS